MAGLDKISKRYAKAVFDFAGNTTKQNKLVDELTTFSQVMQSHSGLLQVLATDLFAKTKRAQVVEDLCTRLKVSGEGRQVLLFLSNVKRLKWVGSIAKALNLLILEASDVVPLDVESSEELSAEEKSRVEEEFKKIFEKQVAATFHVSPKLIGGIRVSAGAKSYDGTLASRLDAVQEHLVGGL